MRKENTLKLSLEILVRLKEQVLATIRRSEDSAIVGYKKGNSIISYKKGNCRGNASCENNIRTLVIENLTTTPDENVPAKLHNAIERITGSLINLIDLVLSDMNNKKYTEADIDVTLNLISGTARLSSYKKPEDLVVVDTERFMI